MTYRALMLSGVPNFVFTVGYTNASWTLKVDLVAEFTCRLLAHLAEHGYRSVVPRARPVGRRAAASWTSPPATCCAPSTSCPTRATASRGGCGRAICATAARIRRAPLDDGVLDFS